MFLFLFFFLLPVSGDTHIQKHKPGYIELLGSLKFRSKSELLSRVVVPFLD